MAANKKSYDELSISEKIEAKKKQGKKKDRSVSRHERASVVWKDNLFHYTHDLMTS